MKAAIITVGDEILAGDTVNTNATWLASRLGERGVDVERILTIPDEIDVISSSIRGYSEEYDAVIVTGGLGPTHDDVTMEGVAEAFEGEVGVDEEVYEWMRGRYSSKDEELVRRTAEIPTDARPIFNDVGVAPGCVLRNVYVFPGVPEEMKAMFEDVEEDFEGETKHTEVIHTSTPESEMRKTLDQAQNKFGVSVGSYPSMDEDNRIKIVASDKETLKKVRDWLQEKLD